MRARDSASESSDRAEDIDDDTRAFGLADVSQKIERLALRASDAARALGISERLLWTLTRRGEVPCMRLGRAIVYPLDELRAWLARRAKATGARPRPAPRPSRPDTRTDSVAE